MTDHIHDLDLQSLAKRAENAEREAARLEGEIVTRDRALLHSDMRSVAYRTLFLIVLGFALMCLFAELAEERDLESQRDAAQAESQLYLDGWRQCKREADALKAIPFNTIESSVSAAPISFRYVAPDMRGFVDSRGHCHGSITRSECAKGRQTIKRYSDGSLFDPTRRIDR